MLKIQILSIADRYYVHLWQVLMVPPYNEVLLQHYFMFWSDFTRANRFSHGQHSSSCSFSDLFFMLTWVGRFLMKDVIAFVFNQVPADSALFQINSDYHIPCFTRSSFWEATTNIEGSIFTIASKMSKYGPEKTSHLDTLHAVYQTKQNIFFHCLQMPKPLQSSTL